MSAALDNRANQLNPNNWRYWSSRGYSGIPSRSSAPTCCSTLKQIITFPFKVIYGLLSLIWNVLSFLFGTCTGWFFMIIFVSVGLFVYFYYYYFHCHGQIFRLEFNCTVPTNFTMDLLPVNTTVV